MAKKKPATNKPANDKPARKPADKVTVMASRCKACGSTKREAYAATVTRKISGTVDGQPYSAITWKRTRCKACQQARVDMVYTND